MNVSKTEYRRRLERAMEKAAQVWCQPSVSNRVMDPELCIEFAIVLVEEMYDPHLGCATTGEIIEELKARSDLSYSTINPQPSPMVMASNGQPKPYPDVGTFKK